MQRAHFDKYEGLGNDFIVVDGEGFTKERTVALCDRHFGVGGDGVLRVVRSAAVGDNQPADWFMDYWNADGSVAEMCGNGVRVFVRYLIEQGLARGPEVAVATRAGMRTVRVEPDGLFTVDMGGAAVLGEGHVSVGGRLLTGLAISVGNPHLACVIDEPVEAVDLSDPRLLGPHGLNGGANIEIVRLLGDHEIEMRVHERGSGLTLSCGTGAVAAAVTAATAVGEWPAVQGEWNVQVPGGRLGVTPSATASLLTGPAEIVARGELAVGWAPSPASAGLDTA